MKYLYKLVLILMFTKLDAQTPCIDGMAGVFPCENVDLLSNLSKTDLGSNGDLSDLWGWTDPQTGREYAILGLYEGIAFIDVTNPLSPVILGKLPSQTGNSWWRDIKVIDNHAFIGSEASNHGIQSFDLTSLRNVINPPVTFSALDVYTDAGIGSSHNIVALEDSKHIVVVGTNKSTIYAGGLVFLDVSDPADMKYDGAFTADGYTHDAVCFTYRGPDTDHFGKEICIASNEDTQTVVDVSDTQNPVQLSKAGYPLSNYTHQGWVTDDHTYLLFDDEFDEQNLGENTRTYVMDISDLDNIQYLDYNQLTTRSIDHNLYIKGQYAYLANYRAGFRMLDIRNPGDVDFTEVAYFDTYPANDAAQFNSAWTVYPYFKSGNLILSDIEQGLFVLRPQVPHFVLSSDKTPKIAGKGTDVVFDIDLESYYGYSETIKLSVEGTVPGATITFGTTSISPNGSTTLTIGNTDNLSGPYHLVIKGRGPMDDVVHDFAVSFKIVDRLYVDQSVLASGDGTRWDTAFKTLQEAIAASPSSGTEIWVAEGTYFPTMGTDRAISFVFDSNIQLYGGFNGTESTLAERDLSQHSTVLSGNIGNLMSGSDNSYHVITTTGFRNSLYLDGVSIESGNANGIGNTLGGGLLNSNHSTVLVNCVFENCFASRGSAIYNHAGKLTLTNCKIIGLDAEMLVTEESELLVNGNIEFRKN